ncbi:MAG: photosynthetic complex putative assembly protein PuhB [Pseudomonadota bacterium]
MNNEYKDEIEPIPGLPEEPPENERILWQGRPSARLVARQIFRLRWLTAYFVLIACTQAGLKMYRGSALEDSLEGAALVLGLGAVAIAIFALLSFAYAKTTVYTITSKRLAMRFGVALPMVVNIPLTTVTSADMRRFADGSGDVLFTLNPKKRMSYILLWPHVRPWRFLQPQPSIRCLESLEGACAALAAAVPNAERKVNEEGTVGTHKATLANA